ncbi:MAG: hypothetical protein ABSA50_12210 [Candidatus Bathyarchaeia archaeon]
MGKTKLSIILITVSLIVLAVGAIPASAQMGVWRDINPDAYITPAANPQLNSIYMLSSTEGWAVGDSRPTTNTILALPAIFHYDGSTWNIVPAPKFPSFPYTQAAYNLTSVTFGSPNNPISRNDGWAVGFNGTLGAVVVGPPLTQPCSVVPTPTLNPCQSVALHWDGVTWRAETAGLSGADAGPLWSAFMVSSTDIWAVGQNELGTAGTFWHWTGVPGLGGGWNEPQIPVKGTFFYGVFMVSATEGWAVGSGGAIYHYFGGVWTASSSPITVPLRSVYMLSPTEGWAAGDGGTIAHYAAGTWTGPVSPGTTFNNLLSVFMISSTEGWAFGKAGTILHYSGGSWTALPPNLVPTTPVASLNFNSAYFTSATDGWGVGTDGVVLHFDGTNYGTITSPTINNFTSISFGPPLTGPIDPNNGWAVGNASTTGTNEPTIYHWNGFVWTKGVAIGVQNNLNSVFMVNGGDAWTVGGGVTHLTATCAVLPCPVILHFTGGSWNTLTPPSGSYFLNSVFMVSSTEGWAVGQQSVPPYLCPPRLTMCTTAGIILHYTVTGGVGTWAIFPAPSSPAPTPPLKSVFMLGANEGWAVGDNATILHYTVTGGIGTWNPIVVSGTPGLSPNANLTSVFMLSPTSGWAVGGIQVCPVGCLGALNDAPVIIYWDGTKWEPITTPPIPGFITPSGHTSGILKSVFFTTPNDGWAVGYPGMLVANIMHWDGTAWNLVTLSPSLLGATATGLGGAPPILTSIYMTTETSGWIVGAEPEFGSSTSDPTFFTDPTIPRQEFMKPLSTILRFAPFGGIFSTTSTNTLVSTVSTSTTALTTTITTSVSTVPGSVPITIKVVDSLGNPVQGATVSIPSLGMQGQTDSQGTITFTVPLGTYTVNIAKGSTSASPSINVVSGGQTFTLTLAVGGAGIPGFPVESIAAGLFLGMMALLLARRKRRSRV